MRKIFLIIFVAITLYSETLQDAKKFFDETQDYKKAIEIFKQNLEDGDALYYLGKAYLYAMGVEKNQKKAFEYAQKSADKNNPSGLNLLGVMYQYGDGIEKDVLQALMYYKQAANLGNTKSMKNLSIAYATGDIIKKDYNEAEKWLLKAYEYGGELISYDLAHFYASTEIKEYNKAIPYYQIYEQTKPSNLDYIYKRLGDCFYELKQYEKSYEYYLKSAELNNSDAMIELYDKFQNFTHIITDTERFNWLKKAALEFNDKYAISFFLYDSNIPYNNEKIELFKKLYQKGNLEAGCRLAYKYGNQLSFNGTINKDLDYDLSYKIIQDIIRKDINSYDDIMSCYSTLSYFYRFGNFLAHDPLKAIDINLKLYEKVNQKINQESIAKFLADTYLEDLQDFESARKWYQITYDLTKDKKYLTIVEQYKKSLPVYETLFNEAGQEVFPVLDTFSKKEQVITYLETEKYGFLSTDDKSIKMYDKESLELVIEFRAWNGQGFFGAFITMAYDEKNKLLYASSINSDKDISKNSIIKVFDIKTRKVIKTIENKKALKNTYLTISDDGKYLAAINNEKLLNIIDTKTNEIQYYNLNGQGKFKIAKIEEKDEDYLVYLLSDDNQLFTFSINQKRRIAKKIFSNQVSFYKKFKNTVNNSNNDVAKIFKLKSFNIEEVSLEKDTLKIKAKTGNLNFDFNNLSFDKSKRFQASKSTTSKVKIVPKYNKSILEIYDEKDKLLSEIVLLSVNALKYLVLDNKYILVVTSDITQMVIFTLDGRPIANLQGFKSLQTNIHYKDGILASFGADNVVHLFDLKDLDEYSKKEKTYNQETLQGFANQFGGNPLDMLKTSDEEVAELFSFNKDNFGFIPTSKQLKSYFDLFMLEKKTIKPFASLYIKNEKDWVIYTPEGLFTYRGDGKNLLKYHQNQGLYKEAKIIENEKLFDNFYRPDLIKKILAGEKVDIPMDVKSVIVNILPPELKILVNKMLNNKDIELTYQICDAGNGIADPKLIINGQAINPPSSRGFSIEKIEAKDEKCKVYKSTHTLSSGENTISLKAYDKDKNIANESEPIKVMANYTIEEKPNLYFISIAVSDYEDDSLDLNYPVNDVKKVKEKIQQKSKSVYENIYTYELHDNAVTLENINKTFDKIKDKIKINDAFILYIAGHGKSQDGLYQFIPYDGIDKISINDIKSNLSKLQNNKSLVLLDTCQSGAALENNIDETATLNRLSYDDNRNYIVASSPDQVALEGLDNHGVFTYSVLDGFEKNSNLKVWGLADHVSKVVPKITQEKFHFQQVPQAKLNKNFTLSGEK